MGKGYARKKQEKLQKEVNEIAYRKTYVILEEVLLEMRRNRISEERANRIIKNALKNV